MKQIRCVKHNSDLFYVYNLVFSTGKVRVKNVCGGTTPHSFNVTK